MAFTNLEGADVADRTRRVDGGPSFPLVGKVAAKPTDGGRRALPVLGPQANRLRQPGN